MVGTLGGQDETELKARLSFDLSGKEDLSDLKSILQQIAGYMSDFVRTLKDSTEQSNKFAKGVAGAAEETEKAAEATKGYERELTKINRVQVSALAVIQAKLKANYAVMNTVTRVFSFLTRYAADLDQELRNLQAITATTTAGMNTLRTAVIEVANSTRYTSLEIARMAVVLGQAGYSVAQIRDVLPGVAQLATATGTDLNTAVHTITSALNIYGLQVQESTRITNALVTVINNSRGTISGLQYTLQYAGNSAANLNMTLEETAAAMAGAAQAGIKSQSMLGTGLRATLVELIRPSQRFQREIQRVGLTLEDVNVKTLGYTQVLRNLRDAGFGVEEAYRGMERRGAAYLLTQLKQVDFIEEIQEKMIGSTAAVQANQTQMEAFNNTIANTKSILGSLASDAFEPFVKMLTKSFQAFNELTKQGAGSFVAMAGILLVTVPLLTVAFVGLAAILFKISGLLKAMAATGGIFGIIGGAKIVGILGGITALTAAIIGIYSAYQKYRSRNTFSDLSAKLEEQRGEINKSKESYDAFGRELQKIFTRRVSFEGDSGLAALQKYQLELITRFPQASNVLRQHINSWEDLVRVMYEAQQILVDKRTLDLAGLEATQAERGRALARETFRTRRGVEAQVENLTGGGLVSKEELREISEGLRGSRVGREEFSSRLFDLLTQRASDDATYRQEVLKVISDDDTPAETRALLQQVIETIKAGEEEREGQLRIVIDAAALTRESTEGRLGFDENVRRIKTGFEDLVVSGIYEEFNSEAKEYYTRQAETTQEAIAVLQKMVNEAEEFKKGFIEDTNSIERVIDVYTQLRGRILSPELLQQKYGIENEEQLKRAIANANSELVLSVTQGLTEFIAEVNETILKADDRSVKARLDNLRREIQLGQRQFTTVAMNDLTEQSKMVEDLIRLEGEKRKEALRLEQDKIRSGVKQGDLKLATELQEEFRLIDETVNQAVKVEVEDRVTRIRDSIDLLGRRTDSFYRSINMSLREAADVFAREERERQSKYQFREARIAAMENILPQHPGLGYQRFLIEREKLEDTPALLEAVNRELISQQALLKEFNDKVSVPNLKEIFEHAARDYERALRGGVSSEEVTRLERVQSLALRNYERGMKMEQDLEAAIEKNTQRVIELTEQNRLLTEKISPATQMTGGIRFGAEKWQEEFLRGDFANTIMIMGKLTYETLNTVTTGVKDVFIEISNGAKNVGQAVRDMGLSILRTIQQVAMEAAAKQLVGAVVGAGLSTGFGRPMATGGFVQGPIRNRDSVPTMLTPGEFVVSKSAADLAGPNFLHNLNAGNMEAIAGMAANMPSTIPSTTPPSGGGTVNVWVVSEDQQPPMGPNDVVAVVTDDIRRGGSIKKLIRQVST
jgi:TP901 family phage tail tape measure protein